MCEYFVDGMDARGNVVAGYCSLGGDCCDCEGKMDVLHHNLIIGGHIVKTVYNVDIIRDFSSAGTYTPATNQIKIYPYSPDGQKTQTWLHELMEAINEVYCCNKLEHDQIEQIAQALYQILPQMGLSIKWGKYVPASD